MTDLKNLSRAKAALFVALQARAQGRAIPAKDIALLRQIVGAYSRCVL